MAIPSKVVKTTWEELAQGVTLKTDIRYTFIVYRFYTDVFEIDDAHYHSGSPIFLPAPDQAPEDPEQDYFTGLGIIAQALKFASEKPTEKLLVAAHGESAGSSKACLALTDARARNVLAFLKGDRKGWAESCQSYRVEDVQSILRFVAKKRGYGCDPGEIDNREIPRLQEALDAFRAGYKREFDSETAQSLPDAGPAKAEDFEAFFELYDLALAGEIETFQASEKDPKKAREKLSL
jgi:hypothetical protein